MTRLVTEGKQIGQEGERTGEEGAKEKDGKGRQETAGAFPAPRGKVRRTHLTADSPLLLLFAHRGYTGLEHPPRFEQLQCAVELRIFPQFAFFDLRFLGRPFFPASRGFGRSPPVLRGRADFSGGRRWTVLLIVKVAGEVFFTDLALLPCR